MLARACAFLVAVSLAACAVPPPPSTSQLPPFFYGTLIDNDTGAINEAAWALGAPSRTRGDPVEALRTAIAVEYLAGELNTAPRWWRMSPIIKMQMLEGRKEFRDALGIRADAPSQVVVNALVAALVDLERDNPAAAQLVFASPLFTHTPQQVFATLNDLPLLPAARAATAQAQFTGFHFGFG